MTLCHVRRSVDSVRDARQTNRDAADSTGMHAEDELQASSCTSAFLGAAGGLTGRLISQQVDFCWPTGLLELRSEQMSKLPAPGVA
jgi:hypothetical protein